MYHISVLSTQQLSWIINNYVYTYIRTMMHVCSQCQYIITQLYYQLALCKMDIVIGPSSCGPIQRYSLILHAGRELQLTDNLPITSVNLRLVTKQFGDAGNGLQLNCCLLLHRLTRASFYAAEILSFVTMWHNGIYTHTQLLLVIMQLIDRHSNPSLYRHKFIAVLKSLLNYVTDFSEAIQVHRKRQYLCMEKPCYNE